MKELADVGRRDVRKGRDRELGIDRVSHSPRAIRVLQRARPGEPRKYIHRGREGET